MWMWSGGPFGWGWALLGWVWMLLFWGGIIALVVWAISRLTHQHGTPEKPTPLEIAKERYARGEVTREQFEQLKKDLG